MVQADLVFMWLVASGVDAEETVLDNDRTMLFGAELEIEVARQTR